MLSNLQNAIKDVSAQRIKFNKKAYSVL